MEGIEIRDGQPDLAVTGGSRCVRVGMVGSIRQVQGEGRSLRAELRPLVGLVRDWKAEDIPVEGDGLAPCR